MTVGIMSQRCVTAILKGAQRLRGTTALRRMPVPGQLLARTGATTNPEQAIFDSTLCATIQRTPFHSSTSNLVEEKVSNSETDPTAEDNSDVSKLFGAERPSEPLYGDHDDDENDNSSEVPSLKLVDERLPCAQHLDPEGLNFSTSEWIHITGTLPICSLREVLQSISKILMEEEMRGIIELDAEWNPVRDAQVPTLNFEDPAPLIEAAHVVISPFGRPNGWHVKFANRSLSNAMLSRGQDGDFKIAWKVVQVREYKYSKEVAEAEDPAFANGLVVDDSMIRIENCPHDLKDEFVRYILSRYDLAPSGNTVIQWKGTTNDGKVAPLMFVIRFADASWARAAVRELQSTVINGKVVKFVQYPKQIRYEGED